MSKRSNLKLDAAKLVELMTQAEYVSKRQLYIQNFIRGIFFGFGSLLGATVLIALLLWVLSLFEVVPLLGPVIESTRESLQQ
jgi:hypothetical protein